MAPAAEVKIGDAPFEAAGDVLGCAEGGVSGEGAPGPFLTGTAAVEDANAFDAVSAEAEGGGFAAVAAAEDGDF